MPDLCNHTADLGEACPDIHVARSDRNDAGYRLCIDPRGVVPPRRSVHWPYNSWFPLELDFGNGRNCFGAFRESVAADSPSNQLPEMGPAIQLWGAKRYVRQTGSITSRS